MQTVLSDVVTDLGCDNDYMQREWFYQAKDKYNNTSSVLYKDNLLFLQLDWMISNFLRIMMEHCITDPHLECDGNYAWNRWMLTHGIPIIQVILSHQKLVVRRHKDNANIQKKSQWFGYKVNVPFYFWGANLNGCIAGNVVGWEYLRAGKGVECIKCIRHLENCMRWQIRFLHLWTLCIIHL